MDRPCIEACEAFAKAGYPDVEALLIVEVEGSEAEIAEQMEKIKAIARATRPRAAREPVGRGVGAIWKGRKAAFGAMGQIADYICLDGTIPVSELPWVLRRIAESSRRATGSGSPTSSMPATATCIR
jgi:glycolate oxidase